MSERLRIGPAVEREAIVAVLSGAFYEALDAIATRPSTKQELERCLLKWVQKATNIAADAIIKLCTSEGDIELLAIDAYEEGMECATSTSGDWDNESEEMKQMFRGLIGRVLAAGLKVEKVKEG